MKESITNAQWLLNTYRSEVIVKFNQPRIVIKNGYLKSNGKTPLYLRVIIKGKKKDIGIGIAVPPSEFDAKEQIVKKSFDSHSDYNMILGNAKAKAVRILSEFWYRNQPITLNQFAREYDNFERRADFYDFYERQRIQRFMDGVISEPTSNQHIYLLKKLKDFRPICTMSDLTLEFLNEFNKYLRKLKNNDNTRNKAFTYMKIYVRMAMKENRSMPDPFEGFVMPTETSRIVFLAEHEVKRMEEYYDDINTPEYEKLCLKVFLLMCFTGLRISDAMRATPEMIFGDVLVLIPHKTRRTGKVLSIPLTDRVKKYIDLDGKTLLPGFSKTAVNAAYKKISKKLEINKNISHHVARHTFATLFLSKSENLMVLSNLMGHYDIKETQKYAHVTNRMKSDLMAKVFDF